LPAPWKKEAIEIDRIAISPDGKLIAIVKESGKAGIVFYDRDTGKEVRGLNPRIDGGMGLFAFTPDGKYFLTHRGREMNAQAETVRFEVLVWEVATGKLLRRFDLRRRQGLFRRARLSLQRSAASDKVLVVGGEDEVATVYDLETGKALGDLPGKQVLKTMALSRNGKWLIAASGSATAHRVIVGNPVNKVFAWDVERRKLLHELHVPESEVKAVAISADGAWCAAMTLNEYVNNLRVLQTRVWVFDRARGFERACASTLFAKGGEGLLFTPDGKTLVGFGTGGNHGLFVWDWQTSSEMRGGYPRGGWREAKNKGGIFGASMASDGTLLTLSNNILYLWDLKPPASPEPPQPKKDKPGPGR
jgi:WD40 repeat protein